MPTKKQKQKLHRLLKNAAHFHFLQTDGMLAFHLCGRQIYLAGFLQFRSLEAALQFIIIKLSTQATWSVHALIALGCVPLERDVTVHRLGNLNF